MSNPVTHISEVTKLIYYNAEKHNAIFMARPTTWAKAQIKVMGYSEKEPAVGDVLRISGEVIKEPWIDQETGKPHLSANGNEIYNYVMKDARISEPGEKMKIVGMVEKVFFTNTEKNNSIALVKPSGWKNAIKVYAPTATTVGDVMVADGYKEYTPAMKDGEPLTGKDGKPLENLSLRATVAETHEPQLLSGPIQKVLSRFEDSEKAIVVFEATIDDKKRNIKAIISTSDKPEAGDILTVTGVPLTEINEKNGTCYENLVVNGFDASISPAMNQCEAASESESMDEPADASMDMSYDDCEADCPSPT